ncbi:hypothetical protein LINPERHAP1_LOCUS21437 [Linum perenne]
MLLTMQGAIGAFFSRAGVVKTTLFQHVRMTRHNVGALVVVKPGEQKSIAGIIIERASMLAVSAPAAPIDSVAAALV